MDTGLTGSILISLLFSHCTGLVPTPFNGMPYTATLPLATPRHSGPTYFKESKRERKEKAKARRPMKSKSDARSPQRLYKKL